VSDIHYYVIFLVSDIEVLVRNSNMRMKAEFVGSMEIT